MLKDLLIDESWKTALAAEFSAPYMVQLEDFLAAEKAQGKVIYPRENEYFLALNLTPLSDVRVVILGQDPYHGEGQAHGLCFSVRPDVAPPPSLVNIYKELKDDLGLALPSHGFLESWARQGVLLLNSVLSVEQAKAAAHQKRGWERFTDAVIQCVNASDQPVVFMLWGAYAQKKAAFVDETKHLVLRAPHPSPLSVYRGYFGCKHFSQANAFLSQNGRNVINWQVD